MKLTLTHIRSDRGWLGITIESRCGHAVTILAPTRRSKAIELAVNYFLEQEAK